MNYTQNDIIFLAGLFEGEGAMWFTKDETKYGPRINTSVAVTNNSLDLLLYLQDKFEGTIHTKRKIIGDNSHITHQWHMAAKDVSWLLSAMLPYLITKKDVAAMIIEFRTTISDGIRRRTTKEDKEKREELYKKYLEIVALRKNNIIKIKNSKDLERTT